MSGSFFNSWQLWEKMTFVLGLAILTVFIIGYCKLLWTNRIVRKQERIDEEKRMKIEELKESGQFVDERNSQEIPFGVRAIQSGIQVDGIWISRENLATPGDLKFGFPSGTSSPSSAGLSKNSTRISLQSVPELSSGDGPPVRQSAPANMYTEPSGLPNYSRLDPPSPHSSYKPRKSSQLRFSGYGDTEYDEETLGQLEGKSPPKRRMYNTQRARSVHQKENEASSSSEAAADNERSSGTSSESDATLSSAARPLTNSERQSITSRYQSPTPGFRRSPSFTPRIASAMPSTNGDYFSVPLESPDREKANPFETPRFTPLQTPSDIRRHHNSRDISISAELQIPLLSRAQSPSPKHTRFVPGELHMNKVARKVNSGFEVLPAGTFDKPRDVQDRTENEKESNPEEKRQANRLQKKPRKSTSSIHSTD
ncbi:hypothetical protein B7494_g3763 [Chlorociboria aeruginascens]|nr:hypothetical protein B7494_g3763 [Chlorociboria aeruginascens]